MNMPTKLDMAQATRLTREGRLDEALAVLTGKTRSRTDTSAAVPRDTDKEAPRSSDRLGLKTLPFDLQGLTKPRLPKAVQAALGSLGQFRLPEGLNGLDAAPANQRTPLPAGARFEERTFANEAGSRPYKLYIPSTRPGEALPLVVMLHGCTQSPDDFAAGTRMNAVAEESGFLVAYPAQVPSANSSKCWNWFRSGDQSRDQGEPSIIAGITREIMRNEPVDPTRVYIAGLSAGGAAAAIMGQTYPELYAAVGVHSGLACGAASDMTSAFAAMRQGGAAKPTSPRRETPSPIPTIVFHGDHDTTVNAINGDQVIAQAKAAAGLRLSVEHGEAAGGMGYTHTVHSDTAGQPVLEQWVLHGAGHAWSGGSSAESYTDPRGPDASREMVRFFRNHATPSQG